MPIYLKKTLFYISIIHLMKILSQILNLFKTKNVIAIYNPIHSKIFKKYKYNMLFDQKSWHPNKEYKIFKNY